MSLHHLVYISRARREVTPEAMQALLEDARAFNRQAQVTGLLLCCHGSFLQYIEGGKAALDEVMARIRAAQMHTDITVLREGVESERICPDWAMAWQMDWGADGTHHVLHELLRARAADLPLRREILQLALRFIGAETPVADDVGAAQRPRRSR